MIIKIICFRDCRGVFILWPKLHVESSHFYGECTASWALFICSLSTLWTLLPYNMFLPIYLLCCAVLSLSVMSDSLGSHGLQSARLLCPWGFCRQEYWSGLPCPPPRGFSQSRDQTQVSHITGQFFYWLSQPGKPKNTGVGSLSLLQRIFLTQESNRVSCIAGGFFTSWATQRSPPVPLVLLSTVICRFWMYAQWVVDVD